ncbi:hypothetical protein A1O1_03940 [Capronia coronata CBS 617.96]|uniref:Uncharacterized protein n=1 Tax=Capronia coronata CBS 617.96 TaxID=1182541 RepID=W9YMF9_9EURO|nr:uncharacterized protein A1O1_03940 [Capronia coronata CBS 617.96]EXJ90835.1 hypothetical protein A1O1_03940 [Capronia coronata CBS 617.96]
MIRKTYDAATYKRERSYERHRPSSDQSSKGRGTGAGKVVDTSSHEPGRYGSKSVAIPHKPYPTGTFNPRKSSISTVAPSLQASPKPPAHHVKTHDNGVHAADGLDLHSPPTGFHGHGRPYVAPSPLHVPKPPSARVRDRQPLARAPVPEELTDEMTELHRRDHGIDPEAASTSHQTSAASMSQPFKIFGFPFAFARSIKAAVLPVNKYQEGGSSSEPDFSTDCGAPFCSAASHTMTNPLRYPVWMLAKICTFIGNRGVHAIEPADDQIVHVHGLVPKSAADSFSSESSGYNSDHFSSYANWEKSTEDDDWSSGKQMDQTSAAALHHGGSQQVSTSTKHHDHGLTPDQGSGTKHHNRKHEDRNEEISPQSASTSGLPSGPTPHELGHSEKVGGYVPMNGRPFNSSASDSRLVPFVSIFRSAILPMRALGWPLKSHAMGSQLNEPGIERRCGDVKGNDAEVFTDDRTTLNKSLGLGSALVRLWEGMRDLVALGRG